MSEDDTLEECLGVIHLPGWLRMIHFQDAFLRMCLSDTPAVLEDDSLECDTLPGT